MPRHNEVIHHIPEGRPPPEFEPHADYALMCPHCGDAQLHMRRISAGANNRYQRHNQVTHLHLEYDLNGEVHAEGAFPILTDPPELYDGTQRQYDVSATLHFECETCHSPGVDLPEYLRLHVVTRKGRTYLRWGTVYLESPR